MKNKDCEYCYGDTNGWATCLEVIEKGIPRKIIGTRAVNDYKNEGNKDGRQYVIKCPRCVGTNKGLSVSDQFGETILVGNEKIKVDLEVLKKFGHKAVQPFKDGDEYKLQPPYRAILIGPTGIGKTLIMKYWYNVLVYKNETTKGIKWIKESEITSRITLKLEENERYYNDLLTNNHTLFIDEAFRRVNKSETDGLLANERKKYLHRLLDDLYDKRRDMKVYIASNYDPASFYEEPSDYRRATEGYSIYNYYPKSQKELFK
jgi:hypothetical protein